MHDSCALGPKFVKFPVKHPKEEFVLWMGLCGHDVGQRGKLSPAIEAAWLQCQKQPFRFRLTHFDHDDIVCGCSPPRGCIVRPGGRAHWPVPDGKADDQPADDAPRLAHECAA